MGAAPAPGALQWPPGKTPPAILATGIRSGAAPAAAAADPTSLRFELASPPRIACAGRSSAPRRAGHRVPGCAPGWTEPQCRVTASSTSDYRPVSAIGCRRGDVKGRAVRAARRIVAWVAVAARADPDIQCGAEPARTRRSGVPRGRRSPPPRPGRAWPDRPAPRPTGSNLPRDRGARGFATAGPAGCVVLGTQSRRHRRGSTAADRRLACENAACAGADGSTEVAAGFGSAGIGVSRGGACELRRLRAGPAPAIPHSAEGARGTAPGRARRRFGTPAAGRAMPGRLRSRPGPRRRPAARFRRAYGNAGPTVGRARVATASPRQPPA